MNNEQFIISLLIEFFSKYIHFLFDRYAITFKFIFFYIVIFNITLENIHFCIFHFFISIFEMIETFISVFSLLVISKFAYNFSSIMCEHNRLCSQYSSKSWPNDFHRDGSLIWIKTGG